MRKIRTRKTPNTDIFTRGLAALKDLDYSRFEEFFLKTLNNVAPVKIKILRYNHNPFMSKSLKEAIMILLKLKNRLKKKKIITAEN